MRRLITTGALVALLGAVSFAHGADTSSNPLTGEITAVTVYTVTMTADVIAECAASAVGAGDHAANATRFSAIRLRWR